MIDRFVHFDPEPRTALRLDQKVKLFKELQHLHVAHTESSALFQPVRRIESTTDFVRRARS
jgi:hypothetical protein